MVQLSITVSFIAVFLYVPEVKRFSAENSWVLWVAMAMTFVLLIVLACCSDFRRRWPLNIILLMLFTLCEGFLLGAISSAYRVHISSSISKYFRCYEMFFEIETDDTFIQ